MGFRMQLVVQPLLLSSSTSPTEISISVFHGASGRAFDTAGPAAVTGEESLLLHDDVA